MILEITIPDEMITVAEAKALRNMAKAQLLVTHADGTGAVITVERTPSLPTALDILNLKMRRHS